MKIVLKSALGRAAIVVTAGLLAVGVRAQQMPQPHADPAGLELSAEVAATTDDGIPSAFRVTLRNVGNVAVDLPMLESCVPHGGGASISWFWHPADAALGEGAGGGEGCGPGTGPSFLERVRSKWIRLRPGEFLTIGRSVRGIFDSLKAGTVTYWFTYTPPQGTADELAELQQKGYVLPSRKLETAHLSFVIR
jgi:hypothetical protein